MSISDGEYEMLSTMETTTIWDFEFKSGRMEFWFNPLLF